MVDLTLAKYRNALLDAAVGHFGPRRRLDEINPQDVQAYVEALRKRPNGRGGTLAKSTQRSYLNCLSNMYRRAVSEGAARTNPVGNLFQKPQPERRESDYLEVPEAALLLEAARVHDPGLLPIVAAFLLTGCRKSELLGLRVEDVDFDRRIIRVRPNQHRRLKTDTSDRSVPLWPQLRSILRDYLFGLERTLEGLLFPSDRTGGMITDLRKALDGIGEAAGFEQGRIRTRLFRHTYTAARLQTLDAGAPVSPYTVSRELGHSSTRMVERVYAHLGEVRHRAEEVEYRADQHPELEDRLEALREAS